jgi:hypothetical protein
MHGYAKDIYPTTSPSICIHSVCLIGHVQGGMQKIVRHDTMLPGLFPHRSSDVRNHRPASLDDVPEPDELSAVHRNYG